MAFDFANGTGEQQARTSEVLEHLRLDLSPLTIPAEFVSDPTPYAHREFAAVVDQTVFIRDDAPSFQPPWDGLPMYYEVIAHELGHWVILALAEETQAAIAALFGTTVESWLDGDTWEDRPFEGIAETFKDAFLASRYRNNPNRTNHVLSYRYFPEFRRLVREGLTAGIGVGTGEIDVVPEYGPFDIFAQGNEIENVNPGITYKSLDPTKDGLWDVEVAELGLLAYSRWSAYVLEGTEFHFEVPISEDNFPFDPPDDVFPYTVFFRFEVREERSGIFSGPWNLPPEWEADGVYPEWVKSLWDGQTDYLDAEGIPYVADGDNYAIGPAADQGMWPVDFEHSITADDRWTSSLICQGNTYRLVAITFALVAGFGDYRPQADDAARDALADTLRGSIPSLIFEQESCSEPGTEPVGVPQETVVPELAAAGQSDGRRNSRNRIVGG